MFQIIGAMAEFEGSLIQERVRAGLRIARAKGKKFGRPRVEIDAVRVAALRSDGLSWSQVCRTLKVSKEAPSGRSRALVKKKAEADRIGEEFQTNRELLHSWTQGAFLVPNPRKSATRKPVRRFGRYTSTWKLQ